MQPKKKNKIPRPAHKAANYVKEELATQTIPKYPARRPLSAGVSANPKRPTDCPLSAGVSATIGR